MEDSTKIRQIGANAKDAAHEGAGHKGRRWARFIRTVQRLEARTEGQPILKLVA